MTKDLRFVRITYSAALSEIISYNQFARNYGNGYNQFDIYVEQSQCVVARCHEDKELIMLTQNTLLRRAVHWISEERKERPDARLSVLLEEAGKKFNLSPLQVESLSRILDEDEND